MKSGSSEARSFALAYLRTETRSESFSVSFALHPRLARGLPVDLPAPPFFATPKLVLPVIEPVPEAQEAWVGHVGDVSNITLRSTCSSWYVGANIPGKPRMFMPLAGGFPQYAERCAEVARKGYEGFMLA